MRFSLRRCPLPATTTTTVNRTRRVLPLACLLLLLVVGEATAIASPPPDLRLEWSDDTGTVSGVAGTTAAVAYRVRNIGGQDAFAVLLRAYSALGPLHKPVRLQPGPRPGAAVARVLAVSLAAGMREVCVEAQLQTLRLDDPLDPTLENNRICRAIVVKGPQSKNRERPDPDGFR